MAKKDYIVECATRHPNIKAEVEQRSHMEFLIFFKKKVMSWTIIFWLNMLKWYFIRFAVFQPVYRVVFRPCQRDPRLERLVSPPRAPCVVGSSHTMAGICEQI